MLYQCDAVLKEANLFHFIKLGFSQFNTFSAGKKFLKIQLFRLIMCTKDLLICFTNLI